MRYFLRRLRRDTSGLTLFELLVAVSLFTIVMVVATSMFLRAIDNQRRSVSSRSLQEGLNYALTYMSAETGDAIQDPTSCDGTCPSADDFFCSLASNTKLVFRTSDGTCVIYEKENDGQIPRLKVTRDPDDADSTSAYLTPETIRLTALNFSVGAANDGVDYIGEVTMSLVAQSLTLETYPDTVQLQTSIAVSN